MGCHVITSYIPKQTDYLIVPDHFDGNCIISFLFVVTPKLLQALVECIPIVSISYLKNLEENVPYLQFPVPSE